MNDTDPLAETAEQTQPLTVPPRMPDEEVSQPCMAFVEGARPQFRDETAALLRGRLRAATLVLSIVLALVLVDSLFFNRAQLFVLRSLILAAIVGSHFVLRSSRSMSLFQLRWFEAGVFGSVLAQMSVMMGTSMAAFAELNDNASLVAAKHVYLGSWAVLILTYGILMPNTWRRALAVLLPTACLPYIVIVWLRWRFPEVAAALRADKFFAAIPVPLVAVLIAVYGTHIITAIRREVFKARQLGQYVLKTKLGAGGMGEVYQAEHQLLKRPCAVKLIKPGKAADARSLARFEREVRATARLTHWNTVEIYDYGHADDGTFYYAMELLPGLSLEELVKRYGPLPPQRAVHFLRQVCHALREAHAKGLIHRDIKPPNIIAAERGGVYDVAKLLDFGLVREQAPEPVDLSLTVPGSFCGSPLFMCPEQMAAYDRLDARSDIYSLGAVAYYLVTGRPPFVGESIWETIHAHMEDPLTPPARLNPAVPADLELVITKCLAKRPADRYQDMASLDKALSQCACSGQWTDEQAAQWWQTKST